MSVTQLAIPVTSVFDRYHIVSDRRLKQLGERMGVFMRSKARNGDAMGKVSGHRQNAKAK